MARIILKVGYIGDPIETDQPDAADVQTGDLKEPQKESFEDEISRLKVSQQDMTFNLRHYMDKLDGKPGPSHSRQIEIQVYREWVKHELNRLTTIAEVGDLAPLREAKRHALELAAAIQSTAFGLSRSRLPLEILPLIQSEVFGHLNAFERVEKIISSRIEILLNSIPPARISTTAKLAYRWLFSEVELKEVFNKMLGVWISADTTFEEFKQVFSAQPIVRIKPISWLNSTMSLIYFIEKFQEAEIIEKEKERETKDYKKMKACFVGEHLGKNYAQLAGKLDTLSPEVSNAIDQLRDSCL